MAFDATAFKTGSGGTDPAKLTLVIASIAIVALILWMAWVAVTAYRAWMKGDADYFDFIWTTLRAAGIAMLLGWFIQ